MRRKSMPVKSFSLLSALLAGLAVAAVLGGWGWSRPTGTEDAATAAAVRAIVDGDPAAPVPAGFAATMGYTPGVRDGLVQRLDGGCTSPWGATSYDFGAACRQHDLGYDLLRFASLEHRPLGGWARQAIDRHFQQDVAARCAGQGDPVRCRAAGQAYVRAVQFNSWRQGWGVPVVESAPALALPGAVGLLVASVGFGGVRRRTCACLRRGLATRAVRSVVEPVRITLAPWVQARAGRLLMAAAVLALCLQPVEVPRPLWVQAVIGGAAAANAYLLTGWLRVLRRTVRVDRVPMAGPGVVLAVAGGLLGLAAVTSSLGQLRLDAAVGRDGSSLWAHLPATPLAVLVAVALVALLVGLARGVGRTLRLVGRTMIRPSRVARGAAVAVLAPVFALGLVAPASASSAFASSASLSAGVAPISAGVGPKGEDFLAAAPAPGVLERDPVRVYVGRDQAGSAAERARLAVEELRRARGFDRSVLLVAVPTGSGWVNSEAVSTLERSRGGDVATVAVQYAASPSWVSYLRGGEGVQRSVRATLDAVDAEVAARPAGERPRVLVYGESLGAWGGIKAYPDVADLRERVDGALWVGVPAGAEASRGSGVSGDGRELVFVHDDDPVPAWSPELIWQPTPEYRKGWLPGVSFWRVTADVIAAASTPTGHGHRYGPELGSAWDRLTA